MLKGQPDDEARVDCTVLVPVFNEERYIEQSVAAMRRQRFDGSIEFVFADGGSTDRTRSILGRLSREDPRIRVFDNPRRSVSSGLNVALAHARGDWVVRMDAHTEYPEDYIALGVARLRAGGTRWVSGPPVPVGHGLVSRAVALALTSWLGRGGSRKWGTDSRATDGHGEEYELDSGVFAGVWERDTLLEYGGWDEAWPTNEDSEMAGRFLARGERLVCLPAMGAEYVPRNSLLRLGRQYFGYGEYRVKTAERHPETLRRSHLLAPAVVLGAAAAVLGPWPLRTAARGAMTAYGLALGLAAVSVLESAERPADAAVVPGVLATMHFGNGSGLIVGVMRHGLPRAALMSVLGLRSGAGHPTHSREAVYAPSLTETSFRPPRACRPAADAATAP